MDASSKIERANLVPWVEIFGPVGICMMKDPAFSENVFTDWEHEDNPGTPIFRTYGETEHVFVMDGSEMAFPPKAGTKYEAIRRLHFGSQSGLMDKFLESGRLITPTVFDDLADSREEMFAGGRRPRDLSERYHMDPAFRTAVDAETMRNLSKVESQRRSKEMLHGLERDTPSAVLLDEFLLEELEEQQFLIDGIFPVNGTCTLVAAKKTGKSTFVYNFLHSLLTGEPLLGAFSVSQVEERIGYVNYELTKEQCQEWFARSPIGSTKKLAVWNLRGQPNPFRSDLATSEFAKEVRGLNVRVLVLDPFSSAFSGENSQDNDQVKTFFLKLDAFKELSGVRELLIPVHAGWEATRSRGASTLEDHPDAIIYMVKQADGIRTLRADGRDVHLEEGELSFDASTLLLRYKGPISVESRIERVASQVHKLIERHGRLTATELTKHLRKNRDDVKDAREFLISTGRVKCTQEGSTKYYSVVETIHPESLPEASAGSRAALSSTASAPFRGEEGTDSDDPRCTNCMSFSIGKIVEADVEIHMCWNCFEIVNVLDSPNQGVSWVETGGQK